MYYVIGVIADNDDTKIVIRKIISILSLNFSIRQTLLLRYGGTKPSTISRVSANSNRGEECWHKLLYILIIDYQPYL